LPFPFLFEALMSKQKKSEQVKTANENKLPEVGDTRLPEPAQAADEQINGQLGAAAPEATDTTNAESEPAQELLEPEVTASDEAEIASPKVPEKIKMLKNFRIEYPLPCRRDTSMCMRLKENQIITDKYLIKYLSQNPSAPFIVIE
jgi:hypothetical protein